MPGGWTALRSGSLYGLVFAQARCFTSVSRGVAVGRPAVVRMYEKIAILQLPSRIAHRLSPQAQPRVAATPTALRQRKLHETRAHRAGPAAAAHSPISICGACQVGLGSQAAVFVCRLACEYCSNVWNTQRVINTGCSMEAYSRSYASRSRFLFTRASQDSLPFLSSIGSVTGDAEVTFGDSVCHPEPLQWPVPRRLACAYPRKT